MIKISIIIPHKNTPDLLHRCLDSIPQREDIEIIVVDNNSSPQLDKNEHHPWLDRAILIKDDESIGPGGARNRGLEKAQGEWVLFADADDQYSERFLDVLEQYVETNAEVVYFNFNVRKKGECVALPYSLRYLADFDTDNQEFVLMLRCRFPVAWNKMMKKDFLQEHHITFKDCLVGEDGVFSFQVGYFAQLVIVDETKIYNYYLNPYGITGERIHNEDFYKCLFEQKFQYNEFFKHICHSGWRQSVFRVLMTIFIKKGFSQCILATKTLLSNCSYFLSKRKEFVDRITLA